MKDEAVRKEKWEEKRASEKGAQQLKTGEKQLTDAKEEFVKLKNEICAKNNLILVILYLCMFVCLVSSPSTEMRKNFIGNYKELVTATTSTLNVWVNSSVWHTKILNFLQLLTS